MYRRVGRREEGSFVFRFIELELFGPLHVTSYMSTCTSYCSGRSDTWDMFDNRHVCSGTV